MHDKGQASNKAVERARYQLELLLANAGMSAANAAMSAETLLQHPNIWFLRR